MSPSARRRLRASLEFNRIKHQAHAAVQTSDQPKARREGIFIQHTIHIVVGQLDCDSFVSIGPIILDQRELYGVRAEFALIQSVAVAESQSGKC